MTYENFTNGAHINRALKDAGLRAFASKECSVWTIVENGRIIYNQQPGTAADLWDEVCQKARKMIADAEFYREIAKNDPRP